MGKIPTLDTLVNISKLINDFTFAGSIENL